MSNGFSDIGVFHTLSNSSFIHVSRQGREDFENDVVTFIPIIFEFGMKTFDTLQFKLPSPASLYATSRVWLVSPLESMPSVKPVTTTIFPAILFDPYCGYLEQLVVFVSSLSSTLRIRVRVNFPSGAPNSADACVTSH
jgi:hypothetical protein